jgi:hypothetical protein
MDQFDHINQMIMPSVIKLKVFLSRFRNSCHFVNVISLTLHQLTFTSKSEFDVKCRTNIHVLIYYLYISACYSNNNSRRKKMMTLLPLMIAMSLALVLPTEIAGKCHTAILGSIPIPILPLPLPLPLPRVCNGITNCYATVEECSIPCATYCTAGCYVASVCALASVQLCSDPNLKIKCTCS